MHCGGHIRDPFIEWVESYCGRPPADNAEGRAMIGSVWHCTDVLPGEYCDLLDIPRGSSYATAAHDLSRWWAGQARRQRLEGQHA